ncbi:HNH endonuclease signature motif containing protein [Lysobacter antibioticus]|uniref:HNH endonuclease signature motif containing protein n=1 Tax=Lysobacter antibioticus TaxID=84531 RepID=UPI003D18856C
MYRNGYGRAEHRGVVILAHRLFYLMHNGTIAKGLMVCHRCDTRSCVNPGHLFLGTHRHNMRDMVKKGRQASLGGRLNGRRRLTADAVRHIRSSGLSTSVLMRQFDVSRRTVQYARNGKTWRQNGQAE